MLVSAEQLVNAPALISVIVVGNETDERDVQPENIV